MAREFPMLLYGRLQDYEIEIPDWYDVSIQYLSDDEKEEYCSAMYAYLKHKDITRDEIMSLMKNRPAIVMFNLVAYYIEIEITKQQPRVIRNSGDYNEWRKAVYERDHYTCQSCGKAGGRLNAHHIKSFARHPDLRLDVNNGITLCTECHKKAHKRGFKYAE